MHLLFQFPIYYHSHHDLMIEMSENQVFKVFTFPHYCSLSQGQYFQPVTTVTSQSKPLL